MALEHFTAIFARELLAGERYLSGADTAIRDLWHWHLVEEIEHKGVAYDTFLIATKDMSRTKRWALKSVVMLQVSWVFWRNRYKGMIDLLKQDGCSGIRPHFRIWWFLWGKPGILRRLLPSWSAYFLPGFHPWNHDDRSLIDVFDSAYAAARPNAAISA
jgi:predicted metal-dependent hydrolase